MKRYVLSLVIALTLSGCAIIRKPPEAEPGVADTTAWQLHRQAVTGFKVWSLQGRVATGQLLGWTGNLSWRQRGERFDARLAGPIGAGGFRATGTLDAVVVQTKDQRFVSADPDVLVEHVLGWSFPLEPLRYWVRGIPAPGDYDSISVDAQGHMNALAQDDWHLSYSGYTQPEGAPAVPKRIVLDNGETRIRLVVDRWFDLGSAAPKQSSEP